MSDLVQVIEEKTAASAAEQADRRKAAWAHYRAILERSTSPEPADEKRIAELIAELEIPPDHVRIHREIVREIVRLQAEADKLAEHLQTAAEAKAHAEKLFRQVRDLHVEMGRANGLHESSLAAAERAREAGRHLTLVARKFPLLVVGEDLPVSPQDRAARIGPAILEAERALGLIPPAEPVLQREIRTRG